MPSAFTTVSNDEKTDETHSSAAVPTQLGRYHILSQLGQGGMGAVYCAFDPELERRIALKVMHLTPSGDPQHRSPALHEQRTRLLREARALAQVNHPNVVPVYDVGTFADEHVFLAMELIDGVPISEYVRSKSLNATQIVELFIGAGSGIAAAHRVGILHRDFKPDNCLVDKSGHVYVLDFGLAVAADESKHKSDPKVYRSQPPSLHPVDATSSPRGPIVPIQSATSSPSLRRTTTSASMHGDLTRYGTILGTPRYMAPEQAYGEKCSAQSDIYSFCIVLHEALSGRHPIAGRARKGDGTFHEPRERHPKVPRWIWKILIQGLALDARKRPASMQIFLDECIHAVARRRKIRAHLRGWTPVFLGAATLLGVIGQLTAETPRVDCDARANTIEQLWNQDRKYALLQQFTLANDHLGPKYWKTVERQLGLWIDEWKDAALTQCRVAHPDSQPISFAKTNVSAEASSPSDSSNTATRSLQSADVERSGACLKSNEIALRALFRGWEELQETELPKTTSAVDALPDNENCLDPNELRAMAPLPKSPELSHSVQQLRTRLVEIRVAISQGHLTTIEKELEQIREPVMQTGFAALEAEFWLELGQYHRNMNSVENAVLAYRRGIFAALRSGHFRVAAEMRLWEIYAAYYRLREPIDPDAALRQAYAWIRASGSAPHQLAIAARTQGIILATRGRSEEALDWFVQQVEIARRGHNNQSRLANALNDLAITYQHLARPELALEPSIEALAIKKSIFGHEHPEIVREHIVLADTLRSLGRIEESVREAEIGVIGCQDANLDIRICSEYQMSLGRHYHAAGRYVDSRAMYLSVLAQQDQRLHFTDPDLPWLESEMSAVELQRGNYQDAWTLAEIGVQKIEAEPSPSPVGRAIAYSHLSAAAHPWLDPSIADKLLLRNQAILEGVDQFRTESILMTRARMDLQAQDYEGAIERLEQIAHRGHRDIWLSTELSTESLLYAEALLGIARPDLAFDYALESLAGFSRNPGLQAHLRVPALITLAKIYFAQDDPYESLSLIKHAREIFEPAEQLDSILADADFLEAQCRWRVDPSTEGKAAALEIANRAIARYEEQGLATRVAQKEVMRWITTRLKPSRSNHPSL